VPDVAVIDCVDEVHERAVVDDYEALLEQKP